MFVSPALLTTFNVTYTFCPRGIECGRIAVALLVTCSLVGARTSLCPGVVPAHHSMYNRPDSGSWGFTQWADRIDLAATGFPV